MVIINEDKRQANLANDYEVGLQFTVDLKSRP